MQRQRVPKIEMQTNGVPTTADRKNNKGLNHNNITSALLGYYTKNMALKSSPQGRQSNTKAKQQPPVASKTLIAGLSWLVTSGTILILMVAILTVTPSQSNPLNSHLLQQVTKPFLVQRDRKQVAGSGSLQSDNMNISAIISQSISPSSSSTSRDLQQKRPIGGRPIDLVAPLKIFKATSSPHNDSTSSRNYSLQAGPLANLELASSNRLASGTSDMNNNIAPPSAVSHDINNNTIPTTLTDNFQNRNVNSVNGTIDLSLYANSDVDRLYGDALLVYVKNFNETLPARRETISLNGTLVPTYRSTGSRRARVPRWE